MTLPQVQDLGESRSGRSEVFQSVMLLGTTAIVILTAFLIGLSV